MSKKTLITSRDPKGLHAVGLFEAVYNKCKLNEVRAQRLNERGGELQDGIAKLIAELSVSNRYADEEFVSRYNYPAEYKGPKPIHQQISIIHELFPEINWGYYRPDEKQIVVPKEADGLFAIPKWQMLGTTYGEAVERVLAMIASKRKFHNYRNGRLGAEYLRQHKQSVKMFQKLERQQKYFDILVVPAQFGLCHKDRSVRRAREVFAENEFGLGAFAVGIMLLTHPEREVQWEQLHVDCAGDEFSPDANGDFSFVPIFTFYEDSVAFGTGSCCGDSDRYGSVTGFLPQ